MKFNFIFFIISIGLIFSNSYSLEPKYSIMMAFDKNYSDGVLTIKKYDNKQETVIKPGPRQLISFLKNNEELIYDFERVSGVKFSDLGKFDLSRNELTFSDVKLFKEFNKFESIESKINKTPLGHCQSTPSIFLTSWDEPASGPLDIKSGENRLIPPGSVLHYSNIVIEENGKLTINNGRQGVTQIKSDGDCIIKGTIESKNFRSGTSGSFEETSPEGDILTIPVQEENLGGRGGHGGFGSYRSCVGYPSPVGGSGAQGTTQFGGGGGGSGYVTLVAITDPSDKPRCEGFKGYDANGKNGGKADNSTAFGGAGGGRTPMRNGGYLFIKCNGNIVFAKNSSLDFSGAIGVKGEPGNPSCGGGGGGGPGGIGGFLVLNKTFSDLGMKMNFNGGRGGQPGTKGSDTQHCGGGEDGKIGDDGYSGSILFSDK